MIFWKHSRWDAVPLSVTAVQMSLNIWVAATWNERTLLQLCFLWPVSLLMFWYNPVIATHNFLHTPWFKPDFLNRIYSAVNSINLGLPQVLYRFHHLSHHRYENDRRGPDGLTRDPSSTFAYGSNGKHESAIAYAALGLFRRGTTAAYHEVRRKGKTAQFWFELVVCLLGLAGYLLLSWRYVIVFFVPTFYLGWFLAHLENYYEHFGATPEKRSANSISYYGHLYNILLCNEGYHQEHHLQPQKHWTRRPETRQKLPHTGRTVSKFPPLFGFLDDRPGLARPETGEVAGGGAATRLP